METNNNVKNTGANMGVNLNIDAVGLADSVFDFSGSQASRDRMEARSEEQRQLDNQFRNRQYWQGIEAYRRGMVREDNYLTRRAADAKKAGISLMASMGGGSYSPTTITMPSGQGGRVAGNYQRTGYSGGNVSAEVGVDPELSQIQKNILIQQYVLAKQQTRSVSIDNAIRLTDARRRFSADIIPDTWIKARNNIDQARQWYKEGFLPYANPDLNLEMPETVGGYIWAEPRLTVTGD